MAVKYWASIGDLDEGGNQDEQRRKNNERNRSTHQIEAPLRYAAERSYLLKIARVLNAAERSSWLKKAHGLTLCDQPSGPLGDVEDVRAALNAPRGA